MTSLAEPRALLDAWEQAVQVPPPARAAVLVHMAGLVSTLDEALDLDVGACAALAMRVHRDSFGSGVDAVVACPLCGELLEARLPAEPRRGPDQLSVEAVAPRERAVPGWVVRAPTTRDLLIAARNPESASATLRSRCARPAPDAAPSPATGEISPEVVAAIDAAAEDLAGVGALLAVVTCPACAAKVDVALDAGALLWERVAAAVPDVLADVATLARAFGWGEAEVLALPAVRRRAYLELAER
ncbi:hypothetical protein [Tessaracoccus sp.]